MDADGNLDGLFEMGFEMLHRFDETTSDAATWTMVAP